MGTHFTDAYSLLHFAAGVFFRHVYIRFWPSILLHILFEWLENTSTGVYVINRYLAWVWPGGKPRPNEYLNRIGDTFYFAIGWIVADQTLGVSL